MDCRHQVMRCPYFSGAQYLSVPFPVRTIVSFLSCSVQTAPAWFPKRLHSNTISHRRIKSSLIAKLGLFTNEVPLPDLVIMPTTAAKFPSCVIFYQHLRSVFSISSSPTSPTISRMSLGHAMYLLSPGYLAGSCSQRDCQAVAKVGRGLCTDDCMIERRLYACNQHPLILRSCRTSGIAIHPSTRLAIFFPWAMTLDLRMGSVPSGLSQGLRIYQ